MSIHLSRVSVDAAIPTSVEELVAFASARSSDEAAQASAELRQLGQSLRSEAQRSQVAEMRRAAEQQMIGEIISASGQILAATGSIVGSGVSLHQIGQIPTNAPEETIRQRMSQIQSEASLWRDSGAAAKAGGDIVAAWMRSEATYSGARRTEFEHAASFAQGVIEQAREDRAEAEQVADRSMEMLQRILDERRRASDAANRA